MSDEPNLPDEPVVPVPTAPDRPPLSEGQKVRDLLIGFFGGLLLNGIGALFFFGFFQIQQSLPIWLHTALVIPLMIMPWVVNGGLLVLIVVRKREWITFGLLMLYAAGGLLVILWMVVVVVVPCFTGGYIP